MYYGSKSKDSNVESMFESLSRISESPSVNIIIDYAGLLVRNVGGLNSSVVEWDNESDKPPLLRDNALGGGKTVCFLHGQGGMGKTTIGAVRGTHDVGPSSKGNKGEGKFKGPVTGQSS